MVTATATSRVRNRRSWMQLYSIYGIDDVDWQTLALLLTLSTIFASFSLLSLQYHLHFLLVFSAATISVCLLYCAFHTLRYCLVLHWSACQLAVASIRSLDDPDYCRSSVRNVLVVGGGRGMLLNSVALRLRQEGRSSGRVVGLERRTEMALASLRTACLEGVEEYVTCREGDRRRMPFPDQYFDVVVVASAATAAAARKRDSTKGVPDQLVDDDGVLEEVAEIVRVLRPGGEGVIWVLHGGGRFLPTYVKKLKELGMEDMIMVSVSDRIVVGYKARTCILRFRKPDHTTTLLAN